MSHPHLVSTTTRAAQADDGAVATFDALVREHHARLCQFAYRLIGSRADAEEIVQDVLTSVWVQWSTSRPSDPLAYLYGAVRRASVSSHRKAFVRAAWQDEAASISASQRTVADEYDERAAHIVLEHAIRRLPERCRLVFTMSREQDLSYREIAHALGVSLKTVETQMGRALKALRKAVLPHLR
jgi:RNA polymerase sigma-70 factor, ECF subfamily